MSIVYINNQYVRKGKLDLEQLFNIEDVTNIAISKQEEVERKLQEIDEYMIQIEEPKKDISMNCFSPYQCPYWEYCTRELPENNIFKIRIMHKDKKIELYKQGIIDCEDIQYENINQKYLEQVDFELHNKEPKINKDKIQEFMQTLTYPLYFLDFETFQQAVPQYDGIRPYMQIPFQYSLHYIENENGELKHKEFLAEDFADLRGYLLKIRENIKDLMIPFYNRDYYTQEMKGSYS